MVWSKEHYWTGSRWPNSTNIKNLEIQVRVPTLIGFGAILVAFPAQDNILCYKCGNVSEHGGGVTNDAGCL